MSTALAEGAVAPGLDERILEAFEESASTAGPRRVSMAGLARGLGISTRTLYQQFPGKAEIVLALMERWANRWSAFQREGLSRGLPPRQRIERTAQDWLRHTGRFSQDFWQQLERDFPQAYGLYRREYEAFLLRSRGNLRHAIRAGLNPDLALQNLLLLIQACADPVRCEQLGLTREEALRQSITAWADGALPGVNDAA